MYAHMLNVRVRECCMCVRACVCACVCVRAKTTTLNQNRFRGEWFGVKCFVVGFHIGWIQEGTGCPWDVRGGNSLQRRRERHARNRCQLVVGKVQNPARRHQVGQRTCHRCYGLSPIYEVIFLKKNYEVIVIIN